VPRDPHRGPEGLSSQISDAQRLGAWGAVRIAAGIALATLGTLLIVCAVPAAITAATIEASVGRSGVVTQPLGELRAAEGDRAVVVDGVSARLVAPETPQWMAGVLALAGTDMPSLAAELGTVSIVATPAEGEAFVGTATVDAVNDYLSGTPYSVAVREGQDWPTVSVPGGKEPALPQTRDFWAASSVGVAPELSADALEGLTFVLMRPDAAPAPGAALRLEYRLPGAHTALQGAAITAASAAIGGFLLVLLGGWLIVGRRSRTQ